MSRDVLHPQPDQQGAGHDRKTDPQGGEVSVPLAEPSAENRGEDVNESDGRGEDQVPSAGEPEPGLREEKNVVEIQRDRQGIQPFEDKDAGLYPVGIHECDVLRVPWHSDRDGRLQPEISSIAVRQYHCTARLIGGWSLSRSAAQHQRIS